LEKSGGEAGRQKKLAESAFIAGIKKQAPQGRRGRGKKAAVTVNWDNSFLRAAIHAKTGKKGKKIKRAQDGKGGRIPEESSCPVKGNGVSTIREKSRDGNALPEGSKPATDQKKKRTTFSSGGRQGPEVEGGKTP